MTYKTFEIKLVKKVPGFDDLEIAWDGSLVLHKGRMLKLNSLDDRPRISIKPGWFSKGCYNGKSSESIQRLVAKTFVPNPKPDEFNVVNHKDGNPQNNTACNLEWCDYRLNNLHAINSGLRTDNVPVKAKRYDSDVVIIAASISQLAEELNLPCRGIPTIFPKRRGKLTNGEWEIKLLSDNTPWFYDKNRREKVKACRFIFHITHEDGTQEEVFGVMALTRKFKIWNYSKPAPLLVKRFRKMYPGKKIRLEDCYKKEFYKTPKKTLKAFQITAENLRNGELLTFPSLRKTAEFFGVDRDVISLRLENGEPYRNWFFRLENNPYSK